MSALIRNRSLGIALVVASLIALVLSGYTSYQTRTYAECQSMVTEQLIRATNARAQAADEDRISDREESEATATLIQTVFAGGSQADRLAAYAAYQVKIGDVNQRRRMTAEQRAANPIPEPPSQVCT